MMLKRLRDFLFDTLRGRIIVSVACVHAVMMTLFVVDLTMRQRAMILDRQTEEAMALSHALATSAAGWIAASDIAGLQELVDAQSRYPEIRFAILTDLEGRVLADSDRSGRGRYILDLPRETQQKVISRRAALVDVATPAVIGGRQVGWARVGIGQKSAGENLARITRSGVYYAIAAILIGSFIAWLMGLTITGRLYAVQESISRVRSGDRSARSSITGVDEAAAMAEEFNAMLDSLDERDAELRASEEKFRSLIHKVPAAIVLHDVQGNILDSNHFAQELLGLSADQLVGRKLIDPGWLFLREDGSVLTVEEYPVNLVLSAQKPLRNQVTGIRLPDRDRVCWMLVSAEPEFDRAGNITQVIVSFIDISERKRAEEALHRLNRQLAAVSNCNQALVRAEDEQTLLVEICRIICEEAGYRMAWVGYAENNLEKSVRLAAKAGVDDGYFEKARLTWADTDRGRGPAGVAIRSGRTDCSQDIATDPRMAPWRETALQRGYRSAIALPLKDNNTHVFGIFLIYSTEPNAFTPDEIRLLEELAADLAFGITVLRSRTAHKEAERNIALLTFALNNVREAAFLIDEQANFHYVNEESCRKLKYTRDELLVLGVPDVDPDYPLERWPDHWNELMNRGSLTFEGRHRAKDGTIFPIEINANYIEYDGQGYNLALVRDITERKHVERKLNEQLQFLQQLLDSIPIPVYYKDVNGVYLGCNAAFETLICVPRSDVVGKTSYEILSKERAEKYDETDLDLLTSPGVHTYEVSDKNEDGKFHNTIFYKATFVDADNRVAGIIGASIDITERKRAEEALIKLNEELEQQVRNRTAELETKNRDLEWLNKAFIGRELRMVELKEKITVLENRLREPGKGKL